MDSDSRPVAGVDYPRTFEFTFRFNRRRSKVRGLLFHRLAEQAVAIDPAPYRTITGKPLVPSASVSQGH
jgi:hypothetical protein